MSGWRAAWKPLQRDFPYSHPDLKAWLDCLKSGDTLVVWKLDRLGRPSPCVPDIVIDLRDSSIDSGCCQRVLTRTHRMVNVRSISLGLFLYMIMLLL